MEDSVTQEEILIPPLNLDSANQSNSEDKATGSVSNGGSEERSQNGVVGNFISGLIHPMSLRTEQVSENENGDEVSNSEQLERGAETENDGNGGLISNLVSNIFHQIEGEGGVENGKKIDEYEENRVNEENQKVKTGQESNGDGGGGIIHNIVSHLPPSHPDDMELTSDEATILINSLVRD